jgi:sulfate adenylyltransferase subunit 1
VVININMQPHENCLNVVLVGEQSSGKTTLYRRLVSQLSEKEGVIVRSSDDSKPISLKFPIHESKLCIGSQSNLSPILRSGSTYRRAMIENATRKVQITDMCGHRSYRNALTSELKKSEIGVLVIPADRCMYSSQAQDSYLEELLQDIKSSDLKLVVVISKVDSLGLSFTQSHYAAIVYRMRNIFSRAGLQLDVPFVPISTIEGDNLLETTKKINWYDGKAAWDLILSCSSKNTNEC